MLCKESWYSPHNMTTNQTTVGKLYIKVNPALPGVLWVPQNALPPSALRIRSLLIYPEVNRKLSIPFLSAIVPIFHRFWRFKNWQNCKVISFKRRCNWSKSGKKCIINVSRQFVWVPLDDAWSKARFRPSPVFLTWNNLKLHFILLW